jgi:hypothetical protein
MFIDRQLNTTGCGPIALVNALRWLGYPNDSARKGPWPKPCFYELYDEFVRFGYLPKTGVEDWWINVMLTYFGVRFHEMKVRDVRQIERALNSGAGVLLTYVWDLEATRPVRKRKGHAIFVTGHCGPLLHALNVNGNGGEYKPKMQEYLKRFGGKIWLLYREAQAEISTAIDVEVNRAVAKSLKRHMLKVKRGTSVHSIKRIVFQELQRVLERQVSATEGNRSEVLLPVVLKRRRTRVSQLPKVGNERGAKPRTEGAARLHRRSSADSRRREAVRGSGF